MERMELPEVAPKRSRATVFWRVLATIAGTLLLYVLWRLLNYYIAPADDPTQRKDVVQAFAVIVGGLAAFGTLLLGWRNLLAQQENLRAQQENTQKTLRNAQEVENRRAQGSSLQAYFEQMGDLLLDKELREAKYEDEVRILAQAQTHTVLPTLSADRKRGVVVFLYKAMLVQEPDLIIGLAGADLREVDLGSAHLSGINVQGADLWQSNLQGAYLLEANLQGAYLEGANLQGAYLQGANLQAAILQGAYLQEAYLQEAILQGATLPGAYLQEAYLLEADLRQSNLEGANLQGAYLQAANLEGADLRGAILLEANLQEANLLEADLLEADLQGANLQGAYLWQAKGVTVEELEQVAYSLEGATMPDGSKHD